MTQRANRDVMVAFPDFGPLDVVAARAHALLVDGRLEEAAAGCRRDLILARALQDGVSSLFLTYVLGQAELELDRPDAAAAVAHELLGVIGAGGDRFWRAKALALLSAAEVDRGNILAGLDALADALAIVESEPPRRYHHVSACSAVAGVLVRLLLFERAAELTAAAARGAARGSSAELLGPQTALLLVRRLVEVHALWAAQLELLGEERQATRRHLATVSAALWMRRLARAAGSPALAGCAIAVEAYATERVADPGLARARARAALATTERPDTLVEWLPGRVALARAAAEAGDLVEARALLAEVDMACAPRHRDIWVGLVQVAAAEVEASAERQEGVDHPANDLWRELAASGLSRLWGERETRFADLRHRILRRELAERSARTARELLVDPLTGLGNRRRLERALATSSAAAAIFIDVDNFKQVNDRFGHLVGDQVLRRVGDILRTCCRGTDTLVRYGGDEFVVLLAEESGATALGRRIISCVRSETWARLTGGLTITVSVGVARSGTAATALRRSERALRAAKQSGRDGLVEL